MINNFSPECTDFMKVEKIGNNLSITSYVVMALPLCLATMDDLVFACECADTMTESVHFYFLNKCVSRKSRGPVLIVFHEMCPGGICQRWGAPTTPHDCFLKVSSMWTTSSVSQSTSSPSIQILLTCKRESFLKMWYIKYYLVFHKTQQFFRNNFLLREVRFIIQYTDSIAIALIPLCGLSDNVKFFAGGKVRRLIQEVMHHYEEETCIRFVPRTNQKDYIVYVYQPG